MKDIEVMKILDIALFKSLKRNDTTFSCDELWESICKDKGVLKEAVKVKANKKNGKVTLNAKYICDYILFNYESVDEEIYQELIDNIYSNVDIARTVIDGASNGGFSFLLMSLWNRNFKLTEEQKAFAVSEALNKVGTSKFLNDFDKFSNKLEKSGITDDVVDTIYIDGQLYSIGAKNKKEYLYYLSYSASNTQAHGFGVYDIRYQILRNPNWSLEEKRDLAREFWSNDEEYEEFFSNWEYGVCEKSTVDGFSLLSEDEIYDYTYESLSFCYDDQKFVSEIWEEIQFCRMMKEIRPVNESEYYYVRTLS